MDRKPDMPLPPATDYNDPDRDNAEQNEMGTQAQDVAGEVLDGALAERADSEPGSPANIADVVPRDVPDTFDTMDGMVHSGRLDRGAFAGEDDMDDEDRDEEYTRPR